jgi:BirA family biotin operon repressor/biotin-[acetyl-CoA-carboxylase] ligase
MPEEVRAASTALDANGAAPDANELYAALLAELLSTLDTFATAGFAAIRPEWMTRHAFQDARIRLSTDFGPPSEGICRGVDTDGALLLEIDGRIERILSGEVSLRPA